MLSDLDRRTLAQLLSHGRPNGTSPVLKPAVQAAVLRAVDAIPDVTSMLVELHDTAKRWEERDNYEVADSARGLIDDVIELLEKITCE